MLSIESRRHQYGLVFDHWQIKELLGIGSGGKTAVYRLEHTDDSGVCSALKVISLIEDRGNIDQLDEYRRNEYNQACSKCWDCAKQEVLLMNGLRGKTNIVGYLDHKYVDWSDEKSFGRDMLILMELLQNLRSDIQIGRPFSEAEVIRIGRDIATALVLCHSKRIIHRDIKPENIFYNEDGDYKLGDFGISKIMSATPRAAVTTDIGTPEYAAPEQTSGKYDERVDIYSLGLVLYELANNNRLPFIASSYVSAEEMGEAMRKRLHGIALPRPCNASDEFAAVIIKACDSDAEKRYQTATELLQALNGLQSMLPTPGISTTGADVAAGTASVEYATEKAKPRKTAFATVPASRKNVDSTTVAAMGKTNMPPKRKKVFIPLLLCAVMLAVGLLGAMLGLLGRPKDNPSLSDEAGTTTITQESINSTTENTEESPSANTIGFSSPSDNVNSTESANKADVENISKETAAPVSLEGIRIHTRPNRTNYVIGDTIDTSGLIVTQYFSDGSFQTARSFSSVTPTTLDTAGKQTITVTYEGYSASFDVFVAEAARKVTWKDIHTYLSYDSIGCFTGFCLAGNFTCDPFYDYDFTVEYSFSREKDFARSSEDPWSGDQWMYFTSEIPNDSSLEGWHTATLYYDGTSTSVEFYLEYLGDYSHVVRTTESAEELSRKELGWTVREWHPVD